MIQCHSDDSVDFGPTRGSDWNGAIHVNVMYVVAEDIRGPIEAKCDDWGIVDGGDATRWCRCLWTMRWR